MECQIILTRDDLEKTVEQTLQWLLFLLCLHLLFCFGSTNTGFVVNGCIRSSVPCRVTSVLCKNFWSLPRSTINLLFLLVKLPIGFAVLCHVLQLSTNTWPGKMETKFPVVLLSLSPCHESQSWAQSPLASLKQPVEVLRLIQMFLFIAHCQNHCARLFVWICSLAHFQLCQAPLPWIL